MFIDCSFTYDLSFYLGSWAASRLPEFEAWWAAKSIEFEFNNPSSPHRIKYPELVNFDSEDRVFPATNTFQKNFIWNPTVTKHHDGAFRTRNGENYDGNPDDLDNIDAATVGQLLVITGDVGLNGTVTVKDNANLKLQGDFAMDNETDTIVLMCVTLDTEDTWIEIARASND